jgi:hypothetical protein
MSQASSEQLKSHLEACGLLATAEAVGDGMYRLAWGSATVVCVARGNAIVAIAPLFDHLPRERTQEFFEQMLRLNAEMGGTAAFAIQGDGAVVLQSGRGIEGLDPQELKLVLSTVGKFADDYDDKLKEDFYS